jgi:hypothetical protein
MLGSSTTKFQQTIPTSEKQKDKGKEPTGGARKKTKVHNETPIYTLTNENMDLIGYQV